MRPMRPMHPSRLLRPLPPASPRPALVLGACGLALLLAGCAASRQTEDGFFSRITPYRIEIVQGNVVTSEQLAHVRPGLTRAQVRDVLGTPLLTDAFHADRWDYVFTLRQDRRPLQRRSVVLIFEGDVLKTIDAPELPTEREFIDSIARSDRGVDAAALELTPEQIQALPVARPAAAASAAATSAAPAATPPRQYPPLEPS